MSLHRLLNDADERMFFHEKKASHQLDYLYADAPVAQLARSCSVQPHKSFSDHAALVADFESA